MTDRSWTREAGDDLPEHSIITKPKGGARRYLWRCSACGMSQRRITLESAVSWAWDHIVGDLACEAVNNEERSNL